MLQLLPSIKEILRSLSLPQDDKVVFIKDGVSRTLAGLSLLTTPYLDVLFNSGVIQNEILLLNRKHRDTKTNTCHPERM